MAAVLIARSSDIQSLKSVTVFIISFVAFVIVCEHLLPMLIVLVTRSAALMFLPTSARTATSCSPLSIGCSQ